MSKNPCAGSLTFLRAELQTGHTFASIAEQAREKDKINRSRQQARKACQSVRHFLHRITVSEGESNELHENLEELERRLRMLDEEVT